MPFPPVEPAPSKIPDAPRKGGSPAIGTGYGAGVDALVGSIPSTASAVATYTNTGLVPLTRNPDGTPNLKTPTDARTALDMLSVQKQNDLRGLLDAAYGRGNWKETQFRALWSDAVGVAQAAFNDGATKFSDGSNVDVLGAFNFLVRQRAASGLSPSGTSIGSGSGGPSSVTQQSINFTNPETAKGLVTQTFQNINGRAPKDFEFANFLKALNEAEAKNPTVTQQNSSGSNGGHSSISTVTKGGFDPRTFAEDFARSAPDSAEFTAATSLLDAFIGSMGAKA